MEVDVLVIGSGGAGMAAAIVAAKAGLKVLLVEKTQYFGGTTAYSGGGAWIPCNKVMASVGLSDTREATERYIGQVLGDHLRPERTKAFLDYAPEAIEYFMQNTAVTFMPRLAFGDYYTELEGAMAGGRALSSVVYDGRELGPWLKKLRPPMQEFNAPMGMMLGPLDLMNVMQATRSWPAFMYSIKLGARFVRDKLTQGRGTRLTMGNALAARLLRSTVDAGVTLWDSSPALKLVKNGNLVTGAVIKHEGAEVTVHARRGVVVATGGFSHDPLFRQKYFPFPEQHQTIVAEGATGDGLRMAFGAGAVMDRPNRRNIFGAVVSVLKKSDGTVLKCPHFFSDLPKPGCIAVNRTGKRFGNEANLELPFAMQESGSVPAYLICDSKFIYKHGLGLVWLWGIRKRMMRRAGYLIEAPSLRALAQKLGIDADQFEKTVTANNDYAKTGIDVEFGRGQCDLDRSLGDPTRKPNPCLGPIETAPFYAVQVFPGDVSSTAGLLTDVNGQVLDANGAPIPGLYANGNDANSLWAGNGISNGVYNGPNLTFGYIIGQHLAQKNGD